MHTMNPAGKFKNPQCEAVLTSSEQHVPGIAYMFKNVYGWKLR